MADSKHDKKLQEMLAASGASLIRDKKHKIYRLPNGQVVPMSQTPSDWRVGHKRITALKRALAKPAVIGAAEIEQPELPSRPMRKKRTVQNNWEPRDTSAAIHIPKLERAPALPQGTEWTPIGTLEELAYHLGFLDDFWDLTPGGRARVLLRTLPPELHAEAVPIHFCRATSAEIDYLFSHPEDDQAREEQMQLWRDMIDRMRYTCGGGFFPALLVHDPENNDDLLVDVMSLSMMSDAYEDIQILTASLQPGGMFFADAPLWSAYPDSDEPPESVMILGMAAKTAKQQGINFITDAGWTDPSTIRHVLEALREVGSPGTELEFAL